MHQERISILRDHLIRFSQPGAFNDPYEMQPYIDTQKLTQDTKIMYASNFDEIIEAGYQKLSPILQNQFSVDAFKKLMKSDSEEFEKLMRITTNNIASEVNKDGIQKTLDRKIVVLCLTEKPDNLLMWAHYANDHEGFVIEFDCEHPFFNQGSSRNLNHKSLSKVIYAKEIPKNSILDIENFNFVITKSDEWGYEEEWRMLVPSCEYTEMVQAEPYNIYLFKVPIESIKRVILGCRASSELIDEAKELLVNHDIQLSQAKKMHSTYGLDFEDI